MATVPNFGALADQQQWYNDDATRRTTWAQRPDQSNPMGSTSWNQNPDGRWVANSSLNAPAQNLFNTTIAGQQTLSGQIGNGVDYGSLPAMPASGFGADQSVIDAWTALNEPGLKKSEDAARARAAAMGITLGSNASNDIERNLGNVRTDANNKAILAGTQEYQNVFNRGMAAREQAQKEANDRYNLAISGSNQLRGTMESLNPTKWNQDVSSGVAYAPKNVYGAALDSYNSQVSAENAQRAAEAQQYQAQMQLAGQGLSNIGGIMSGIGSLWNAGKDVYNWFAGS